MAPRAITAKALQALLTRIGSAAFGTKDVLQARFARDVTRQHIPTLSSAKSRSALDSHAQKCRIISIDMGIKNLAFCDVEVDYLKGDTMQPRMNIIRWDKLDLVDATKKSRQQQPDSPSSKETRKEADEEMDPYSLSVLSQTAHSFLRKSILAVSPDIILIERQRWRSASSAAIQQWTVRVNTLEAMLWAILSALNVEQSKNSTGTTGVTATNQYEVFGVDPKRVGQYWLVRHARAVAERQAETTAPEVAELFTVTGEQKKKREPRSKAEKKAKIAILRSWLTAEPASTAPSTPSSAPVISITVGPDGTNALQALTLPAPRKSRKKATNCGDANVTIDKIREVGIKDFSKLDDIADSCLQVAAWVAWESNRRQLYQIWEQEKGKDGKMSELDDDVLKEMIEVAKV
ncbi:ribonuclease H-like protein [Setomelanomma holmii]|uniref:Ribonuclease H-like protein n=1 Tax=Setomelanomma holmii TaxID=210430 RepID=A0A9P4LRK2_9PLEO|nr:ribonuclease H-like protein [Setomelanomma holmii]